MKLKYRKKSQKQGRIFLAGQNIYPCDMVMCNHATGPSDAKSLERFEGVGKEA